MCHKMSPLHGPKFLRQSNAHTEDKQVVTYDKIDTLKLDVTFLCVVACFSVHVSQYFTQRSSKEYDVFMLLGSGKSTHVGSLSQPKPLLLYRKVNKSEPNMYTSVYCKTTEIVASLS